MTRPLPPQQLITTSLVGDLRAKYGVNRVGDHELPANPEYPFVVLYTIDGGDTFTVTGWDRERNLSLPFQLTCVGKRRDQVQLMADSVRSFMLERDTSGQFSQQLSSPPGWSVCGRLAGDAVSGVLVEGKAPNQLYSVPLRFTLQVTPA